MMNSELEAIRKKKLMEMQQQVNIPREKEEEQDFKNKLEAFALRALDSVARQRWNNIKLVNEEYAYRVMIYIAQLFEVGRIKTPINDKDFKELLKKITHQRRDISIRRK